MRRARLLHSIGRLEETELMYRRALKIYEESLGPQHLHTKVVRENLEILTKESKQQKMGGRQKSPL